MAFKNMVPERVTSCRMLTKSNECYSVMAWMYRAILFCEVYIKSLIHLGQNSAKLLTGRKMKIITLITYLCRI